jgi:hypothetical protein
MLFDGAVQILQIRPLRAPLPRSVLSARDFLTAHFCRRQAPSEMILA